MKLSFRAGRKSCPDDMQGKPVKNTSRDSSFLKIFLNDYKLNRLPRIVFKSVSFNVFYCFMPGLVAKTEIDLDFKSGIGRMD
jgi:hypothetical protein